MQDHYKGLQFSSEGLRVDGDYGSRLQGVVVKILGI